MDKQASTKLRMVHHSTLEDIHSFPVLKCNRKIQFHMQVQQLFMLQAGICLIRKRHENDGTKDHRDQIY